jgi:hypothetical protein
MGEIHRDVKPRGEVWAVETHCQSDFMDLRGPEEQANDNDFQTFRWYESHGFSLVDEVESAFVFPALAEAERGLSFMFEEKAYRYPAEHPSPRLQHGAIIVRKQGAGA